MRVSFIVSAISGTIIFIGLIIFIILFTLNYNNIRNDYLKVLICFILIGIGFGIHSLNHNFEEIFYDFNPLANKWKVNDKYKFICSNNNII